MIPRYNDGRIEQIFSNEAKVARWQDVELAVIEARANLGLVERRVHAVIRTVLKAHPCDIKWWLAREKETMHDLAAFIDERLRSIPVELQPYWHEHMTSYDTEDPAFVRALLEAASIVLDDLDDLTECLKRIARTHRYTLMLARTHGQGAKLRTFGSRVLTWLQLVLEEQKKLVRAVNECKVSRISGAIGNYGGGLTPELEREALELLGLEPYIGATQITPRLVYAPLAQSLRRIAEALGQIAVDFRLGARSGLPLWHEPFGKQQKGSSAMPHKKNTISTEQLDGMLDLVCGAETSIMRAIQTWEERAIEQSCVERVAWPDLFHEVLRMISVMHKVFGGIVVYPDHMLQEIQDTCGTYASDEAKNFLAKQCAKRGEDFQTAYGIVQLASFCVFEPDERCRKIRSTLSQDLFDADALVTRPLPARDTRQGIREVIVEARLFPVKELDVSTETVAQRNALLKEIFSDETVRTAWEAEFLPSQLLKEEPFLFKTILGDD